MDFELSLKNNSDSIENRDPRSIYVEYELNVLNKIILLLSGYEAAPFFNINIEDGAFYPMGLYPNVVEICPEVNTPHVSQTAIKSLLNEFAHFGSAVHMLSRLNDILSDSYKDSQNKRIAPSLIVLMLEEETVLNGFEHGTKDKYDWYWKDNFSGFCTALSIIFNDWRLIMFKIQEKYFKTVYNHNGEWVLYPNFIRNLDELTSPIFELLDTNQFITNTKESRVLDLYVKTLPYLTLMEGLTNLIELVLNYMNANSIPKSEMPNAMLTLLVMKIRTAEMTNDKIMMRMWRFLLFYAFKDRNDYVLTMTTDNMFSIFEESVAKSKQLYDNIKSLDPVNSVKNLNLIFDNDLKRNLLQICNIDSESIEFKLISYLNYKFKNFITLGMGMTESILKNKYNYNCYLYLFNSIALGQFGDNMFKTKSMAKDRKIKPIFDQICTDQLRFNSTILSDLKIDDFNTILSAIKIDFVDDKYEIGIVDRQEISLFHNESFKKYTLIFNHILEFLRFRQKLESLVIECKWRTNKNIHSEGSVILFLLIHLGNSLMTYFSLIIQHFWDEINKVNYGESLEEIKTKHLHLLTIICNFLFVPKGSEVYFDPKVKIISQSISKIFKISDQLKATSIAKESNRNSDTYKKLKSHFDDIISTLDRSLIDDFVNYENWSIFSNESNCVLSSGCAKAALHSTLSLFKSLLSFNHTPL